MTHPQTAFQLSMQIRYAPRNDTDRDPCRFHVLGVYPSIMHVCATQLSYLMHVILGRGRIDVGIFSLWMHARAAGVQYHGHLILAS